MLDRDLAEMYGVQTKALNQAVKRNIDRFPEDFMFQLTSEETQNWRSQFVTSNSMAHRFIKRGLLHSHCFCLFSSLSIILHTLSTSLSEGIISGSIHVRKSLIIAYIHLT